MLTAWIAVSTVLAICGMFGELRKGESIPTALIGFVCTFILWPVLIMWMIFCMVLMFVYVLRMKFF